MLWGTNFVSGTQKMFLISFRNILCPRQMFPSLRAQENIMSNNVSATMCPRLPVPLLLEVIYVIFARATNTDVLQAIVARATKPRINCRIKQRAQSTTPTSARLKIKQNFSTVTKSFLMKSTCT